MAGHHTAAPGSGVVASKRQRRGFPPFLPLSMFGKDLQPTALPPSVSRPVTRRVLIVEDNEDARETLRLLLELDGHDVEVAADGQKGLELAQSLVPDVLLLDIGLPGLDGYQVARALASHPERARIQIVALTGYGQESDRKAAFEAGFDLHFVKPIEPDRLRSLLTGA